MVSPNGILNLSIESRMPFSIVRLHAYTFVIVLVNLLLIQSSEADLENR